MRDSCIFYRSFYEAMNGLDSSVKANIYDAIFEYSLNGILIELSGLEKTIFTLIKPQLDANNKRFENGKKGGKPKQNNTKTKPKRNQNVTETEANNNVNDNDNVNNNENENFLLVKETKGDSSESEILPLNNQKEKEKKIAPKKEKETIEATPEFLILWNEYKDYRVAKKKSFKFAGLKWEQQAFDKFYSFSNGKIEIAKQILNQSITNNWDGLFELKETFNKTLQQNETTSAQSNRNR